MGQRGGWIINESGLYALILGSEKLDAKKFKHWVTSEVLPTIRRTGSYSIQQKQDSYMIENPAERARRWAEEYEEKLALEQKIEQNEPLVEYASQIQISEDTISMAEMAKIAAKNGIKIGRTRLFEFLRKKKILDYKNVPYQRYVEQQPICCNHHNTNTLKKQITAFFKFPNNHGFLFFSLFSPRLNRDAVTQNK